MNSLGVDFILTGSGNTWTRYLVEGVSGFFTSSIYNDGSLMKGGYLGKSLIYYLYRFYIIHST